MLSDKVNPWLFGAGILNLACFGLFLIAHAMLFSSLDRFRWRTLGILAGLYIVQAMIKVGALASESFRWLQWFTYFTLYEPSMVIEIYDSQPERMWWIFRYADVDQIVGLGPLGMNLALLTLSMLCLTAGAVIFHRRDLPAPL